MNKEIVVVSLGGSSIYSGSKIDPDLVRDLCYLFEGVSKKLSLVIVVGGGPLAKQKADEERAKGKSEFYADLAAIEATRENARNIAKHLPNSALVNELNGARVLLLKGRIVVSGGLLPGITTDAVSVLFAEMLGAKRVVNVSKIQGVFDSDPRKNPGAKMLSKMSHEDLVKMAIAGDSRKARENFVFDVVASKLAARSKIELHFVSSGDERSLENALLGRKHGGTVVS